MATLHQIVAIEKGLKAKRHSYLSEVYKTVQKPELFDGFFKTYQPKTEGDSECFAPESKQINFSVPSLLQAVKKTVGDYLSYSFAKDKANCQATASVVINGAVLISDAPVTLLLSLEKELVDLRTFFAALPTLSGADSWTYDTQTQTYRTEKTTTQRTKKTAVPIVLCQATEQHPAQTQLITEDVFVGTWSTVKTSGAISHNDKQKLLDRVEELIIAVKSAREEANAKSFASISLKEGSTLLDYLLD